MEHSVWVLWQTVGYLDSTKKADRNKCGTCWCRSRLNDGHRFCHLGAQVGKKNECNPEKGLMDKEKEVRS